MPSSAISDTSSAPAIPGQANDLWRWWWFLLGITLLWDLGGADLPVMRLLGHPDGFPLRNQWLLAHVLHDEVRQLSSYFYLLMWAWAVWPERRTVGPAALWTLPRRERITVALLVGLSLVAVNIIKNASHTSCPWDLQAFGGPAHYVSHWALGVRDGGGGRCFPGGHASSAYAFLGLCLPWLVPPAGRIRSATAGWRWLGFFMLAGLIAGAVQTVRGAHYPSHTLWTLVICAGSSLAGWRIAQRWIK